MSYAEDLRHDLFPDELSDSPKCNLLTILKKTCSICNKTGLHWEKNSYGKWKLFESNGKLHKCNELPIIIPKNNDFEMDYNNFYVAELITRNNGIKFKTIIKYVGDSTIKLLDYDNKEYEICKLKYFRILNKINF